MRLMCCVFRLDGNTPIAERTTARLTCGQFLQLELQTLGKANVKDIGVKFASVLLPSLFCLSSNNILDPSEAYARQTVSLQEAFRRAELIFQCSRLVIISLFTFSIFMIWWYSSWDTHGEIYSRKCKAKGITVHPRALPCDKDVNDVDNNQQGKLDGFVKGELLVKNSWTILKALLKMFRTQFGGGE